MRAPFIMTVGSVSDVWVVHEMLKHLLHSEVCIHVALHQLFTGIVVEWCCLYAADQTYAEEDELDDSCRTHSC